MPDLQGVHACRAASPQLVSKDVRDGKVKVVYKAFETATRDPNVFKDQQVAALAAGKQQKFWDYAELFYHEQGAEDTGYVNENYLQGLAKQVPGLNLTKWESDRNDGALVNQVAADVRARATRPASPGRRRSCSRARRARPRRPRRYPVYSDLQQVIQKVQ